MKMCSLIPLWKPRRKRPSSVDEPGEPGHGPAFFCGVRPMFLYWKQSTSGKLWVSERSLFHLMEQILPEGYRCENISLWDDQNALNVQLGYPGRSFLREDERLNQVAEDLKRLLRPLGFREVFVTWGQTGSFSPHLGRQVVRHPLFWAAVFAGGAAFFLFGFLKTLYALFWGCLGYGLSRLALGEWGHRAYKWCRRFLKG